MMQEPNEQSKCLFQWAEKRRQVWKGHVAKLALTLSDITHSRMAQVSDGSLSCQFAHLVQTFVRVHVSVDAQCTSVSATFSEVDPVCYEKINV